MDAKHTQTFVTLSESKECSTGQQSLIKFLSKGQKTNMVCNTYLTRLRLPSIDIWYSLVVSRIDLMWLPKFIPMAPFKSDVVSSPNAWKFVVSPLFALNDAIGEANAISYVIFFYCFGDRVSKRIMETLRRLPKRIDFFLSVGFFKHNHFYHDNAYNFTSIT